MSGCKSLILPWAFGLYIVGFGLFIHIGGGNQVTGVAFATSQVSDRKAFPNIKKIIIYRFLEYLLLKFLVTSAFNCLLEALGGSFCVPRPA